MESVFHVQYWKDPFVYLCLGPNWAFFSVADAFPMEIDKHQAMFRKYNRTFRE